MGKSKVMKIGFIGLGIMGKPMSKNLIKAKYDLVVFDTNVEAMKELADLGAIVAHSPKKWLLKWKLLLLCCRIHQMLKMSLWEKMV